MRLGYINDYDLTYIDHYELGSDYGQSALILFKDGSLELCEGWSTLVVL